MMTQRDLDELEKYYTANAPQLLEPESSDLVSRVGKQVGNLPSNILESFLHTGQAIGNLGLSPSEQSVPVDVPHPFDIPEPKGIGQSAIDVLLGHIAPELAAALVPYAGVTKLSKAAGLGKLGSEIAGQATAGAFTGIKESPEEAIQQAIVGGGLGGITQLQHLKRLLPLAGLTAADVAWNYAEGADPTQIATQSGLDIAMGLLPGSIEALKGYKSKPEIPSITADEIIPPTRDRRALRIGYGEGDTGPVIAPEFSGRPQLMPPSLTRDFRTGPQEINLDPVIPDTRGSYVEEKLRQNLVYPRELELPRLSNTAREATGIQSPIIDIPAAPVRDFTFSEIFTGEARKRPITWQDPIIPVEQVQGARAIPQYVEPPALPLPEQNPLKGKIPIVPEYRRTEGGQVQFPILSGGLGGVIGGTLPADSDEERLQHIFGGALIGAALPAAPAIGRKIGNKFDGVLSSETGGLFKPAYKLKDGTIRGPLKGETANAHFDVAAGMSPEEIRQVAEHGFVDDSGKFYTRDEAHEIALKSSPKYKAYHEGLSKNMQFFDSSDIKDAGDISFLSKDKPKKIAGISLVDSEGRELARAPIGKTHADIKPEAMDKFYENEANLEKDPFTSITHAFHDEDGNILSRQEAYKVAKENGQLNEDGLRKASLPNPALESQDLKHHKPEELHSDEYTRKEAARKSKFSNEGGFVSTHALTTVAGAGIGGEEGYRRSGGDPGSALAGAVLGGAGGYLGYKVIESLARPNPRLKSNPKAEIKGAAKAMMEKRMIDLAGEDVRGRGGIMSKFIKSIEHWGQWHMPPDIKTAWTRARGTGVLGVQAVKDSLDNLKGFKPSPEIEEATSKYIKGRFLPEGIVETRIQSEGGITSDQWKSLKNKPEGWGVWKVGDKQYHISPELRGRLMEAEEAAFKKHLGPENEMYFKFVNTARKAVDNLQHIYAEGMPDGYLKQMIKGSTGQYVTRTYKIFNDPNYQPTEKQIEASMKELGAFLDSKGVEHTRDYLRGEIEQYLHDVRINKEVFGISSRNKIDSTLLKEREELTPIFRELLGEYTDPKEVLLQAISRLYPSAQASRFISLAKEMSIEGMPGAMTKEEWVQNSKLLEEEMSKASGEDLKRFKSERNRLNEYVEIPKNLKYGALKGMKVNRFVADQLLDYEGPLGMASHPIMRGVNNWSKIIHTVYDPIRHVRNLVTTPMFLWMGRASPESTQQAWSILRSKSGAVWKEMVSNGILTADQVASEFRGKMDEVFNGHYDSSLTKKFKAFHNNLLEVYRFPDLVVRAATYLEAKSRYSKELKLPITDERVIKKAVEWTDSRTMNYDNIAPAVRLARQLPFFNLYISYTSEITRIMKNVAKDAMKGDIHSLAQLGTLAGAFEGVQAISEAMLSEKDRKDWQRANAQSPAYSRSRYKIVTGRDSKGNFKYLDVTPWIPTDNINQMVRSIAKGDTEGAIAVNPIMGLENTPIFKLISETTSGQDAQTKRDFRGPSDTLMNIVEELSPSLTPGIGYEWKKISSIGEENTKTGRQESWGGTITRYVTGLNYTSVNPTSTQRQAVSEAKRHIANERAYLNDTLKMKGISPEARQRAVKKYQDAVATALETFRAKADTQ